MQLMGKKIMHDIVVLEHLQDNIIGINCINKHFLGQMQQTFVVLHDKNASKPGPYGGKGLGGNSQPLTGKKRMRDPADVNNDGKKKGPGGSNAAKK